MRLKNTFKRLPKIQGLREKCTKLFMIILYNLLSDPVMYKKKALAVDCKYLEKN